MNVLKSQDRVKFDFRLIEQFHNTMKTIEKLTIVVTGATATKRHNPSQSCKNQKTL